MGISAMGNQWESLGESTTFQETISTVIYLNTQAVFHLPLKNKPIEDESMGIY
jgi:hypothetical protein